MRYFILIAPSNHKNEFIWYAELLYEVILLRTLRLKNIWRISSFQKQIEPYILRLVIEEDKMSFISCCTFLIVFLIHFFIVIEAVRNGHTDIVRFLKINGDDVNKEGRVR